MRANGKTIPILDEEACVSCGLCAGVCGLDVIRRDDDGRPAIQGDARCNVCGHCVAICPQGALSFADIPAGEFAPTEAAPLSPSEMRNFLLTKRSCREFLKRPVEAAVIDDLIEVARTAPTAINCQERAFIVVTDPAKIAELRAFLADHIRSTRKLVKLASSKPAALFLDPDTVRYMETLHADFEVALRHTEDGDDYFFHDAPCLIFFTGIGMDPAGKDHALGALHYLMLYAETLGLGTCINGYAQSAPKLLAKRLDVPKFHTIYGALMVGYRKHAYRRTVYRKPAVVVRYGE